MFVRAYVTHSDIVRAPGLSAIFRDREVGIGCIPGTSLIIPGIVERDGDISRDRIDREPVIEAIDFEWQPIRY